MNDNASNTAKIGAMQDTLERGVDKATSSAHSAVDRAGAAASQAAGAVGSKGDDLNATGQRMIKQAGGYLRDNPVATLGLAVAAGYLLSRLLSSR